MKIEYIEVLGGVDRNGREEYVRRVILPMGKVASVIGPTGSGKTALITDIELCADRSTPSKRKVLINGESASEEIVGHAANNPVAFITQHTNFLSDLPVSKFISIHARTRKSGSQEQLLEDTLDFANQLTGEPIDPDNPMTQLSGGQTRALLIADAVVIGKSPILLLDEIENAGINRARALELLKTYEKIFIFVTHDPRIALLSDFRIIMGGGGMKKMVNTTKQEMALATKIATMDELIFSIKQTLWNGDSLDTSALSCDITTLTENLELSAQAVLASEAEGLIEKSTQLGRVFGRRE